MKKISTLGEKIADLITSRLRGTGIYLNDDLCHERKRMRASLVPVLKELKKVDVKAHFRGEKIFFRGRLFSESNLYDLPIDAHNACTKSENGTTIFARRFSRLSNLHLCKITIEGRNWPSVEHFYQFQKAATMGKHDVAASILAEEDPMACR